MVYKLLDSSSPSLSVKLPEITIEEIKEKHNLTPQELKDNLVKTMKNYLFVHLLCIQIYELMNLNCILILKLHLNQKKQKCLQRVV